MKKIKSPYKTEDGEYIYLVFYPDETIGFEDDYGQVESFSFELIKWAAKQKNK